MGTNHMGTNHMGTNHMGTNHMGTNPADDQVPMRGPEPPAERARPFPVVLHLEGAPCLVVGAGPVAARKARGLLDAGAAVTLVAPVVGAEVRALVDAGPPGCGSLAVVVRPYRTPEASSYRLVVSATGDPGVDARVVADARAGGALVNRADSSAGPSGREAPAAGTVDLPAVHRAGPVAVAVSTGGSGPALARWLRDRIAAGLADTDVATLAGLVEGARAQLVGPGREPPAVDWASALDRVAPLVAAGRIAEARELLARLTGTVDPGAPHPTRQRR
jgi:siroheme synthase-like protein